MRFRNAIFSRSYMSRSYMTRANMLATISAASLAGALAATTGCSADPAASISPMSAAPVHTTRNSGRGGSVMLVNVSRDTTAQNETPLAVNPMNPQNLITGANDWN